MKLLLIDIETTCDAPTGKLLQIAAIACTLTKSGCVANSTFNKYVKHTKLELNLQLFDVYPSHGHILKNCYVGEELSSIRRDWSTYVKDFDGIIGGKNVDKIVVPYLKVLDFVVPGANTSTLDIGNLFFDIEKHTKIPRLCDLFDPQYDAYYDCLDMAKLLDRKYNATT
jgi:hypothetical protein